MNLKKFLSMIMVLSMTAAVFTGCGSSSDSTSDDSAVAGKKGTENNTGEEDSSEGDKEKLTFWDFHTGTEADVIQDMVNAYNQSQDKVKVEYSSVNQTDYTTTLVTTAYANGECPDILWVEPATFKKFSDAEMLADLSSYYTDDLKKDILPSFLEAASGDDGKIYTLPFECETLGLFYDADALEEEGLAVGGKLIVPAGDFSSQKHFLELRVDFPVSGGWQQLEYVLVQQLVFCQKP